MARLFVVLVLFALLGNGCSRWDAVRLARIAATRNVAEAKRLAAEKGIRYATDPKALERDIKRFHRDFARLIAALREAVGGEWGEGEVKEPAPKEYVKYLQNYRSRALVDFDAGVITVETVARERPLESLRNAIVTALLTPNDPRAVDLFSAKPVRLGETPFLYREVRDHEGKNIRWAWRAGRFADHLLKARLQTRTLKGSEASRTVHFVSIPMEADHHQVRATKYRPLVEEAASRYSLSRNLVYAIAKTESDFNPYAVSPAPAFGLMQIVPTAAGQEVYRFLHGKDGLPSAEFLLVPANNIRYGSAYLHLLKTRHLQAVQNPVSREYCVIAAYNTGPGNVLRTFARDRDRASRKINALTPLQVFDTLRQRLPYQETRRYLAKVMAAKKEFVKF